MKLPIAQKHNGDNNINIPFHKQPCKNENRPFRNDRDIDSLIDVRFKKLQTRSGSQIPNIANYYCNDKLVIFDIRLLRQIG